MPQDVVHAHLAALEARDETARRGTIGLLRRIDLGKRQQRADSVQPVLDRGVADAEELLHLLDGAVAADEGGDEHLIVGRQRREGRHLEAPFDRDVLAGEADALDLERGAAGQSGERLPILGGHSWAMLWHTELK